MEIVVFGGGDWSTESSIWQTGVEVGALLAEKGFTVVTGGYQGAMAAVSKGAKEHGGHTVGILNTSPAVRKPNDHVEQVVIANDYQDRLARLTRYPHALALPGGWGTFAEIAVSIALLQRFEGRSLAVWGPFWRSKLMTEGLLDTTFQSAGLHFVDTVSQIQVWLDQIDYND